MHVVCHVGVIKMNTNRSMTVCVVCVRVSVLCLCVVCLPVFQFQNCNQIVLSSLSSLASSGVWSLSLEAVVVVVVVVVVVRFVNSYTTVVVLSSSSSSSSSVGSV